MLFKRVKETKLIKSICFKKFDDIEKKLNEIATDIKQKNISRKYALIILKLHLQLIKIEALNEFLITEELKEKKQNLYNFADKIVIELSKIGIRSRKEILIKLDEIDTVDNKTNDEIKSALEWIWNKLNLDNICDNDISGVFNFGYKSSREVVKGVYLFGGVSYRQMHSYEYCIKYVMLGNIYESIHSLNEFVDNYQLNENQPFNSFELISIKNMINAIMIRLQE